ncbi:aspartyl-phosphate phosphatase Spo0E family protein [Bacillus velezensis]|nr:aspartyl-phosphate phosphatase Spo0E family protein [Bacillus velezensis]
MIREHLLNEIEKNGQRLLKIVMTNGMTSNITIELSQELDHLLIQYQKNCTPAVGVKHDAKIKTLSGFFIFITMYLYIIICTYYFA